MPFNFSRRSELALEWALSQTRAQSSTVYMFHVLEETTRNYRRLDKINQEAMERMRTAFMQVLSRLRERGIVPTVQDVERRFGAGKAAVEILQMAEGIAPDMIVMGAPTSSTYKKLVLNAPCTIVLVKDKGEL